MMGAIPQGLSGSTVNSEKVVGFLPLTPNQTNHFPTRIFRPPPVPLQLASPGPGSWLGGSGAALFPMQHPAGGQVAGTGHGVDHGHPNRAMRRANMAAFVLHAEPWRPPATHARSSANRKNARSRAAPDSRIGSAASFNVPAMGPTVRVR